MKLKTYLLCIIVFSLTGAVFAGENESPDLQEQFTLTSPTFKDGEMMPVRYHYRADNKSPALKWRNAPANAVTFSLTCIDYDPPANGYVHWNISNIPAAYSELPEGIPAQKKWKDGIVQDTPWIGPHPPKGVHHYRFVIEAKDASGKMLAKATLIGLSD